MHQQEISEKEIPFVLNRFNRSLWWSLLVFPFILIIIFLPLYLVIFFINSFFLKQHFDHQEVFTYYFIAILTLVVINFLYGKIIIGNKIKKKEVYKIQESFLVQKKDSYTYTSETASDSHYFKLYLSGEDHQQKGIYVSKEDYKRIKEGSSISLTYFKIVDIPVEGFYESEKMDSFRFFVVNRWEHIKRQLFFC
ncbi:hypothetical protein [Chryseobacterium sp. c4a]|uniref:hypothetical protein n=1 Tax=Chryseobacterium sp. c4a TaxID=1573582 RepID=UPI00135BEA4E|nr:hypothetical protein [Chryseobacterium sp. c4a]